MHTEVVKYRNANGAPLFRCCESIDDVVCRSVVLAVAGKLSATGYDRPALHNPILTQIIRTQAARFCKLRLTFRFVRIHRTVGRKQEFIQRLAVRSEARAPDAHSDEKLRTCEPEFMPVYRVLDTPRKLSHFFTADLQDRHEFVAGVAADEIRRANV